MFVLLQGDAVDLKLLVCSPNAPLHVDMFLLGRPVSKVGGCFGGHHPGLVHAWRRCPAATAVAAC
jgi:hypothetical protein